MIVTITPNPSVDRTLELERLDRGQVLRTLHHQVDPGGKGINVARALHANGHATRAVVPIGGAEGDHLLALLGATGVSVIPVSIAGAVRSNVTIVESDGTVTKINEPGPALTDPELAALLDASTAAAIGARWVVVSGSLPAGARADLVHGLVGTARAAGAAVAVDTSGTALRAAIAVAPDLVKPNAEELAEVTGRDLRTLGDAIDAARDLVDGGVKTVLASLGPDGALAVTAELTAYARCEVSSPASTVGAGDATLAGYLSASGDPLLALRTAVAYGSAAVSLPGSQMPEPHDLRLDAVQVHERPERAQQLRAPASALHGAVPLTP